MPMRIFYVPSNISIENLRHIFPPSTRMSLLPKCHLPHPLSKTTFFSRPAAHPLKIRKQNRSSKFKKKHNHTNAHTKSKQKSNSKTSTHKNQKQTHQKDNPKQSIKPHQLENIPPRQPFKSNKHPPKSHSETIHPKTQGRFPSNASAFHSKRRRVRFQTQRRFT